MKNAIIIHGKPSKKEYYDPDQASSSNYHWFPWLQKQLVVHDIFAQTPEIPNAWQPNYEIWTKEFERYELTPETILVGHSCGAGFLVRYLSEHKDLKVGKVVLVAPWIDPFRDEDTGSFFDFEIDPNLAERASGVTIFNSDDDDHSVHETVKFIREKVKDVNYREFHNYGHFCLSNMKTEKFPELLDEIVG